MTETTEPGRLPAERVRRMFDSIAPVYVLARHRFFAGGIVGLHLRQKGAERA